jgi:hypothetical protein
MCACPFFPRHSFPGLWAPRAMSMRSGVFAGDGHVDCRSLQESVQRGGEGGCCVLCVGPVFTRHFLPGPQAPRAMSERSGVLVGDDPVGCRILQEGVQSEGGRGCCVMCASLFLPIPWAPRAMSTRSVALANDGT